MNQSRSYGMICPITRACDVLEPRWTIPILVALWGGETRFNDIRRAIGSVSPALLSRRLKELEQKGLIERVEDTATGAVDYLRTDLAIALEPALNGLAQWAQEGLEAEFALSSADISVLMWDLRRFFRPENLPNRRVVMRFHFNQESDYDTYFVVLQPQEPVEICTDIPGFDVDLYVETTVPSLLGILLGRTTIARELALGELFLSGDQVLARTMDRWLRLSEYAAFKGVRPLPEVRRLCPSLRSASPTKPAKTA